MSYPKGKKMSPESNQKRKDTWKKKMEDGYTIVFTEEHRKNLSRVQSGKNNPRYGKRLSEETKDLIRRKNTGKKRSKAQREKVSGSNHWNWNPDRELVAKNAAVRHRIIKYMNLPLTQKVNNSLMLEKLNYDKEQFINNFESKFFNGMAWQNHGVGSACWQSHHKIPVPWFFEFGIYDIKVINALSNFQPLWFSNHWREHKRLNKFTKKQRKFWVVLFTYYMEQDCHKPLDLCEFVGSLEKNSTCELVSGKP